MVFSAIGFEHERFLALMVFSVTWFSALIVCDVYVAWEQRSTTRLSAEK